MSASGPDQPGPRPRSATAPSDLPPLTYVARDEERHQTISDLRVWHLLWRVFRYARPHRRLLAKLTFFVVLRSLLLPVLAWAIGAVINGPVAARDLRGILLGAAGFAALAAVTQLGFHFRMRYALELGEAVVHDLRGALFRHLMRLTPAYFDRTKIGRLIARLTSDVDAVRVGIQDIVFISAVQGGQMLVTAVMMAYYDWVLFAIVLAMAPVIWVLNRTFKRRIGEAQRKMAESFSRVTATLAESVGGVRVTQGFARQNLNARFFHELVTDHSRYNLGAARTTAVFLPLLELNSQFFIALLLVVGGWRVLGPGAGMNAGAVVQFFFLANLFFDPIRNLGNQYTNALAAMVGAERVFRLLDEQPDWEDPPAAARLEPGPPAAEPSGPLTRSATPPPPAAEPRGCRVEFRGVGFAYEPGRPVLRDINFTAEPGQTVALVGHTGSGKTTITGLVAKFYLPTGGLLLIDGHDVKNIAADSLHRVLGIVTQQTFLFGGTVLDNIRFSRPEAPARDVIETVRHLGFLDLIEALPEGFHTEVGEGGGNLSSGERQLVSFARALLVEPRVLILDEATSAIDALTESRIQSALATLLRGRTSFVVAHRLSTIRAADLILVLRDGRIIERGTHGELLGLEGVYRHLHDQFIRGSRAVE